LSLQLVGERLIVANVSRTDVSIPFFLQEMPHEFGCQRHSVITD
jgi:hypothetical protein